MQLILSVKWNLKSYTIPRKHSTWILMVAFLPLSFLTINRTVNKASYLQGKIPSHRFNSLGKISQEGGRTQRNLPLMGTGQRQLLSALKLQGRKSHPFQLQQAIWDTGQTAQERTAACPHTIHLPILIHLVVFLIISTVSLTNGQSSMCQTPSSLQVIKGRTRDSGGNTWDWQ